MESLGLEEQNNYANDDCSIHNSSDDTKEDVDQQTECDRREEEGTIVKKYAN